MGISPQKKETNITMNLLKITTLCALLLTGAVITSNVSAQKTETVKSSKMHKACTKCAKAGMKECSHDMAAMGKTMATSKTAKTSKMHKACTKCAKAGMKECSHPIAKK
jgi:hypothetical protein